MGTQTICEFCEQEYDLDDGWFKTCSSHGPREWMCICDQVGDSSTPLSNCEVPGCEGKHKAICQCRVCPECFEKIKAVGS